MDDDILADGLDYADEQRRRRRAALRDEDGNPLYDFWQDDEINSVQCACGIWWPACDMLDGQCPECREVE